MNRKTVKLTRNVIFLEGLNYDHLDNYSSPSLLQYT
jgi:hypothetical protein